MDRRQAVAVLCGAGSLVSCGRHRGIAVGSKNFTEQVVLGEIVAQHLEHRLRVPVERRLDLGGTLLAHQALLRGSIDVYPEYTGTALTAILRLPPLREPAAAFERVRQEYRGRFHADWFDPLGFDNSFAMVIREDRAHAEHLRTLSDAARHAPWILGVGYEFLTRPDGLPALRNTYHLPVAGTPKTMDLGLLYVALEQKQVEMVAGSMTDGLLSVRPLTVLHDDRRAFPPYQAALVAREAALARHDGMREALRELSGRFSEKVVRALNYAVDGRHQPVREVAAGFLGAAGLGRLRRQK